MGLSTGKVLDYTTNNKMCRSCYEGQENNQKTVTVEKIIWALQSQWNQLGYLHGTPTY